MRGRAGGHLPGGGRNRSGTTLRQNHAIGAECRCGTDDRAQILRVGDAVERDEQRTGRDARGCRVCGFHGAGLLVRAFHEFSQ